MEKCLLNLCAYEWMNVKIKRKKLFAYVKIMDDLIDSKEDVQLLRRGKDPIIVGNYLGRDKVIVDLFNSPLKNFNVHLSDFAHFKEATDEIRKWYMTCGRIQLTSFLDGYRIAPWLCGTLVVGLFLLVVSVLQAIEEVEKIQGH
ncbi:hypothetical protein R1flu_004435 [Riccia fluitans]|uniref:Uncharacterized protein n=1 Tax=Riccia fluitans TaxID=41844 RepID=A0ABD1YQA3_9MARC